MQHYIITLSIIKAITVVIGLVFLFFTWKAYRKAQSRALLILFIAIGLMVAAAVAEGASLQILGLSLDQAHVIEAFVTLAAFAVLLYSVLSHRLP